MELPHADTFLRYNHIVGGGLANRAVIRVYALALHILLDNMTFQVIDYLVVRLDKVSRPIALNLQLGTSTIHTSISFIISHIPRAYK